MSALVKVESINTPVHGGFDNAQVELIRDTICKGATPEEFQLFLNVCKRTGLCPFAKQIYPVKRKDKKLNREVMTIQTSIDGYRLIAERTGRYAPGREPAYEYDKNGQLLCATNYVKKQTLDGTWHEVAAKAYFSEFAQGFKDFNTGQKKLTSFWEDMPHNQLAKCAESLALRKAFPGEFSQVYTKEEMAQAENDTIQVNGQNVKPLYIQTSQAVELSALLNGCSPQVQANFSEHIKKKYHIDLIDDLPLSEYETIKKMLTLRRDDYQKALAEMANKKEEPELVEE